MSLPRTTAAALTAGIAVLLVPLATATPASAQAPTPTPTPTSGSLLDLVPSLVNGLLTGPVATVGSSGGSLQVGVLPSAGSTPIVAVQLPGVLGLTVGGTGTSTPGPTTPPPGPPPSTSPPPPSPRTPRPTGPGTTTPAGTPGSGALPVAPPAPGADPATPTPTPSRTTGRPVVSPPLVDSIRQSIPAALALTAGSVLLGVAVLYVLSILGTGRRRPVTPVGAAVAVVAPAPNGGAVLVDDPEWDFTLDASGTSPGRG